MTDVLVKPGGPVVPVPTLVQADQVTILGDGSHGNPLVAASSGPGGIDISNEGVPIVGNPHLVINFVGGGVLAVDAGGGQADIEIPGGPSLSDVDPTTISDSTNDPGASASASRADHQHAHGDRGGGALHSSFTSASAGFIELHVVTPSPARALDAAFQPNATRPTLAIYSVDVTCSLTGGVGAGGAIQLLSDAANPPTTIRCEFFLETGGGIDGGETVTNVSEGVLVYLVPEGHFVSLTTVPAGGSPIFGFGFSTEITL
jgi:hypothetical protein